MVAPLRIPNPSPEGLPGPTDITVPELTPNDLGVIQPTVDTGPLQEHADQLGTISGIYSRRPNKAPSIDLLKASEESARSPIQDIEAIRASIQREMDESTARSRAAQDERLAARASQLPKPTVDKAAFERDLALDRVHDSMIMSKHSLDVADEASVAAELNSAFATQPTPEVPESKVVGAQQPESTVTVVAPENDDNDRYYSPDEIRTARHGALQHLRQAVVDPVAVVLDASPEVPPTVALDANGEVKPAAEMDDYFRSRSEARHQQLKASLAADDEMYDELLSRPISKAEKDKAAAEQAKMLEDGVRAEALSLADKVAADEASLAADATEQDHAARADRLAENTAALLALAKRTSEELGTPKQAAEEQSPANDDLAEDQALLFPNGLFNPDGAPKSIDWDVVRSIPKTVKYRPEPLSRREKLRESRIVRIGSKVADKYFELKEKKWGRRLIAGSLLTSLAATAVGTMVAYDKYEQHQRSQTTVSYFDNDKYEQGIKSRNDRVEAMVAKKDRIEANGLNQVRQGSAIVKDTGLDSISLAGVAVQQKAEVKPTTSTVIAPNVVTISQQGGSVWSALQTMNPAATDAQLAAAKNATLAFNGLAENSIVNVGQQLQIPTEVQQLLDDTDE